MGAGKTTIGKQLAKALQRPFYDSDQEIEANTGVDIPTIFDFEGEPGFRDREKKVLEQLTSLQNVILATGGGVVLDPDNRQHLKGRGTVVYLYIPVEEQLRRTQLHKNNKRPLLHTDNPLQKLTELMHQKAPLYEETADIILPSNSGSIDALVNSIIANLTKLED